MRFKQAVLIFWLCLLPFYSFAQFRISGRIINQKGEPLEFVEVILFEKDSIPLKSELSDANGFFSISQNEGSYKIQIRQIGEVLEIINISLEKDYNLGDIQVENLKSLKEVVIVSPKDLIERRADKLIYNVENSAFSTGVSAQELLKNVPRIDPSSEQLKIIGKSNVRVMVNDRLMNLSGRDLENYLKTLRSENISKVEVITNPSSKYDAAGNGGLINIILKKKSNLGFDGTLSGAYTQRTKPTFAQSARLNYSNDKLILGYNLYLLQEKRFSILDVDYFYPNLNRSSEDETENTNTGVSNNFNLDYAISKRSNLGLHTSFSFWDFRSDYSSEVKFIEQDEIIRTQRLPSLGNTDNEYVAVSPYYDITLDSLGTKLKFNYNYLLSKNQNNRTLESFTYSNNFGMLEDQSSGVNNFSTDYEVNTVNVDLELPFENFTVELGAKYSHFNTNTDIKYFDDTSGIPILDDNLSNEFVYKEQIIAGFATLEKIWKDIIYLELGMRYENTQTDGNSITLNDRFQNQFNNFFPSVYLSYDPHENHSLSVSYNRRIDRPSISDVNPFRTFEDFFNFSEGNERIFPSITQNLELGYVYKGNLSFSTFYSIINDNIDFVTLSSPDDLFIVTRPENFLTTQNFGVDLSYNLKIGKFFNSYNNFNLYHQSSTSSLPEISDENLQGLNAMISSNNTFILNKEKGYRFFINYFYAFASVENIYQSKALSGLSLGANLSFFAKKLYLRLALRDIFNTTISRNTVDYQDFIFRNRIFNDIRNFNVSLTYRFGNRKSKKSNRDIDDSEEYRISN